MLVSVSFFGILARAGIFLGGEVSEIEGLTPFAVSIPSTVTVFPGGSFHAPSSFFFVPIRGRSAQEVRRKRKATEKGKMPVRKLLLRVMSTPFYPS
jgi:hypothetical protein